MQAVYKTDTPSGPAGRWLVPKHASNSINPTFRGPLHIDQLRHRRG